MMIKNKRGWIKIVEAFIAIMLVSSVLLIVINKGYVTKTDDSKEIYEIEKSVLKEIQLNEELRSDILSVPEDNLSVKWDDFDSQGLDGIKEKIETRMPNYLTCNAKLCKLKDICSQETYQSNVYVSSIAIAANLREYSPRQLKMFCWIEE